jgi:predicted DNA-binding protein (UPF0251 family)
MPRPRIPRCVQFSPEIKLFKPHGVPTSELDEVVLLPEEMEAIRLSDRDGLQQAVACIELKVSQPTFARILGAARKKVAEALVTGKAIRIQEANESGC